MLHITRSTYHGLCQLLYMVVMYYECYLTCLHERLFSYLTMPCTGFIGSLFVQKCKQFLKMRQKKKQLVYTE